MEAEPSRTAMMAAVARGQHRLKDAYPWVLDDPLALVLVGPGWQQIADLLDTLFPADLMRQARAGVAARSRYAEDRLEGGGFTQCVLLGAGLDSLAWRRPDLLDRVILFEVDHPASQAWKRQRIDELCLPRDDRHVFVPVDFEVESLRSGLDAAGFDWARPTLFSWLGVAMYLTTEAIEATLRTIAGCRAGSEVVFTFLGDVSVLDDEGRAIVEILEPVAAQSGEPIQPGLSVKELERLVTECGLQIEELPTREELMARYFVGRSDGLGLWTPECLAVARVPGGRGAPVAADGAEA